MDPKHALNTIGAIGAMMNVEDVIRHVVEYDHSRTSRAPLTHDELVEMLTAHLLKHLLKRV